jgi:hypothetical protein
VYYFLILASGYGGIKNFENIDYGDIGVVDFLCGFCLGGFNTGSD